MSSTEVIEQIQALPKEERGKVLRWFFSDQSRLDEMLDDFDRLPRAVKLTEEEALALPRARHL